MAGLLAVFLANPLRIGITAVDALRCRMVRQQGHPAGDAQRGQDADHGNLAEPQPALR